MTPAAAHACGTLGHVHGCAAHAGSILGRVYDYFAKVPHPTPATTPSSAHATTVVPGPAHGFQGPQGEPNTMGPLGPPHYYSDT